MAASVTKKAKIEIRVTQSEDDFASESKRSAIPDYMTGLLEQAISDDIVAKTTKHNLFQVDSSVYAGPYCGLLVANLDNTNFVTLYWESGTPGDPNDQIIHPGRFTFIPHFQTTGDVDIQADTGDCAVRYWVLGE